MSDPFIELDKAVAGHRDSPLNPEHVTEVFEDCLSTLRPSQATDMPPSIVEVQGIVHTARFSRSRLDRRKREIAGMLDQLPTEFQPHEAGGGGGWSFLNACNDRDGNQWTGLHLVMEQLILLGIGTGQVEWCMPREMWKVLPGEMPYFVAKPVT